jgi:DNA repair protein RadA/Sms
MARALTTYVCQSCGATYGRWQGKCESCGAWNTIAEESVAATGVGGAPVKGGKAGGGKAKGRAFALAGLDGASEQAPRTETQVGELDRVFGGGLVRGSVILLGGDPGIGKSTLLIQASARLARMGHRVVYISGEEAVGQVRLRAERLGLTASPVELAAETNVEDIVATLAEGRRPAAGGHRFDPDGMWTDTVESAPGTVSQVRASAQVLIRYAKKSGAAVILVGHVTKDGQIAGPRVVEHMVDAVMSFEGDGGHHFRILRSVKNRFGPTDEIGVFEMTGKGLREVPNPSELFLGGARSRRAGNRRLRRHGGHAAGAGAKSRHWSPPRRSARRAARWSAGTPSGSPWCWRCSMPAAASGWAANDVYLNVAGGLRIASRRRTSQSRRRSSPRCRGPCCRRTPSISARSACRAPFGPWRRRQPASRRPASSVSSRPWCRKSRAANRPRAA